MIRPILACADPYKAAEEFASAGWKIDFSQRLRAVIPWSGYHFAIIRFCWALPKVMLLMTGC